MKSPEMCPRPVGTGANRSYCSQCGKLVPATKETRDNQVFLVKACPTCGRSESLVSGDAARYAAKSAFDTGFGYRGCGLDCTACNHGRLPNLVFIDITNRCNLNCPICINNTPAMGFKFEPPFAYFAKILDHLASFPIKPSVQLFGGEPTVRSDLFEIIRYARGLGLPTRVVTNGVRLADPEYCRQLIATKATILIAYDGADPKVYAELRGSAGVLAKKQQALDNIAAAGNAKVTLMTLIARGFNDRELPGLLKQAHDRRHVIRAIYFMPLTHTWDEKQFDLRPERTTMEDVEGLVAACFPTDTVEFIPAGYLGELEALMAALGMKPLPFLGAHPNCESMYALVSDGTQFVPVSRYVKTSTTAVTQDLMAANRALAPAVARAQTAGGVGRAWLKTRAVLKIARIVVRHARLGELVQGRGPAKLYHGLALLGGFLLGRRSRRVLAAHSRAQGVLQLVILPFEDRETLETDRMERCPTAFAWYDPATDRVGHVPVCAWTLHKTQVMRQISEHYAAAAK
jgi:7,8-dihydro-6-hydroxymethylpterin dimethyltransferase